MARSLLLKDSRAETSYLTRLPMKITEALLAEHVVFHNLFDHVERTASKLKSVAEVKSLANLIESLLKAHSEVEEELLVEPLDHCLEQIGHRETFHQEHEEIEDNLRLLQKARQMKQARKLLVAAVAACRRSSGLTVAPRSRFQTVICRGESFNSTPPVTVAFVPRTRRSRTPLRPRGPRGSVGEPTGSRPT